MIKLVKPYIEYSDIEQDFKQIFESGWFTKGVFVDRFRESLRKYTGAKDAYLTTSATTALSLSLKILGIKAGDEVIVADFSFPATANVVEDLGATPVFVDVDLDTFNMLPDELESKITSKTKAVIFVDVLGNPSGIHSIKAICEKHNLPLIDDAACAIGSSERSIKSGNIADLTCFSFHPRKLLTTGEGGAITINSDRFAELLDIKLNHGAKPKDGILDFVDYGYNYRLTEMQSAMGIHQINRLNEIIDERNKIRQQYVKHLEPSGYKVQLLSADVVHNVQSLVFKVPDGVDRDHLIQHLKENEIESTLGTYALSATSYYRLKYDTVQRNSVLLQENTITLPCYDGVPVERVCDAVFDFTQKVPAV